MSATTPSRRQIAGADPDAIGGEAFALVPEDYNGPCRLTCEGAKSRDEAVFPTYSIAAIAATYAVSVSLGGFHTAELTMAAASEVTHRTWVDWLCA
ncbi:hypothetical protein EJP67_33360 [Variovorax guangxiensis]|uniref:Uncharacterized protein n=1 Tax=Variovorax guangxiensis TaxID=1775474 RepID=A0A3S0ZTL3_9BURK|nr:hypothetical protein [Variovorax guangxiensis]RUR71946.1 hypothetical protein EJP67_33360 [Variovorax guangxiensis]